MTSTPLLIRSFTSLDCLATSMSAAVNTSSIGGFDLAASDSSKFLLVLQTASCIPGHAIPTVTFLSAAWLRPGRRIVAVGTARVAAPAMPLMSERRLRTLQFGDLIVIFYPSLAGRLRRPSCLVR